MTTTAITPKVTCVITHQGHCNILVITASSPVPENNWNRKPNMLKNPLNARDNPIPKIIPRIIEKKTIESISNSTSNTPEGRNATEVDFNLF